MMENTGPAKSETVSPKNTLVTPVRSGISTTDSEFDKIYVNGDNTLPNIKTDEEHWKVVLIEEEFKKRMFE